MRCRPTAGRPGICRGHSVPAAQLFLGTCAWEAREGSRWHVVAGSRRQVGRLVEGDLLAFEGGWHERGSKRCAGGDTATVARFIGPAFSTHPPTCPRYNRPRQTGLAACAWIAAPCRIHRGPAHTAVPSPPRPAATGRRWGGAVQGKPGLHMCASVTPAGCRPAG